MRGPLTEALREAAVERRQKRATAKQAAENSRRRWLRQAFSSPTRDGAERELKRQRTRETARERTLTDISETLASGDTLAVHQACSGGSQTKPRAMPR